MSRSYPLVITLVLTSIACAASAETMRCHSLDGNVTCAGSGAVSCQTVDGRTMCVGGNGDIVQSFGGKPSQEHKETPGHLGDAGAKGVLPSAKDRARSAEAASARRQYLFLDRQDAAGSELVIEQNGGKLRIRTPDGVIALDR